MGELAARALVEGLAQSDDRAERHFLEIKSFIDLKTKEGVAKVAKFILGAANRMPDVAARYFEGHAVMVLGVGAGSTPGIEPVEALDIERGVRPYLSVNGPRWDLQRVPVEDGREVLLVIVDPPRMGQPPYPCFRDGPGLYNGQIIIRGDGETRQATGEEVFQLQQRGRLERPDVNLDVVVDGTVVAYTADERVLEDHIQQESARLTAATRVAASKNPFRITSIGLVGGLGQREEDRTEDEYRHEIERWGVACRASWPSAIDKLAAVLTPPVAITITNREEIFLEDVRLEVHLGGPVRGMEPNEREDLDLHSLLPSPPRSWGPWVDNSMFRGLELPRNFPYMPTPGPVSRFHFRNGGSVNVEVAVGDLRPREVYQTDDDEMVLVTGDADSTQVTGTWKITARGHHAVYAGSVVIPVERRDITTLMQRLLSRLRKDDDTDDDSSGSN